MNRKTLKTVEEIRKELPGFIEVSTLTSDGQIRELKINNVVVWLPGGYSSAITVSVEQDYTEEDVFHVAASCDLFTISKTFKYEHEADACLREVRGLHTEWTVAPTKTKAIKRVYDDGGEEVVAGDKIVAKSEDLPF
jgi:hypothetical protein